MDFELLFALVLAGVLGLRHAADPDHLVAVTSLVAADDAGPRDAARLGAWWGAGHAAMLLALGIPLIALGAAVPAWLEAGAETAVGLVIVALAGRVIWKWARGSYESRRHRHGELRHRHLARDPGHRHAPPARSARGSFAIGLLHGLAGSGAVVVLLLAGLGGRLEAAVALAVFAPMSVVSMAGCTAAFAWALTRRPLLPAYRGVLVPALGLFGLTFGLWYAALA